MRTDNSELTPGIPLSCEEINPQKTWSFNHFWDKGSDKSLVEARRHNHGRHHHEASTGWMEIAAHVQWSDQEIDFGCGFCALHLSLAHI